MIHRILLMICLFAWHAEIALCQQQTPEAAQQSATETLLPNTGSTSQASATNVEEFLRMEIVKAELDLEKEKSQYGPTHPNVVRLEQQLERLNAKLLEVQNEHTARLGRLAGTHTQNTSPLAAGIESQPADRTAMEAAREAAETQYQSAEAASRQAAMEYRKAAAQQSPDAKAVAALKQKLESAVHTAFEAQMKLQQIRLQLAELNLIEVKERYERRESLAAKIVERHVADLMQGEGLNRLSSPESTLSNSVNMDAALDGNWTLRKITGTGIWSHESNLQLRTSPTEWTMIRGTHESKFNRRLNYDVEPYQIDVFRVNMPDAPPLYTGIYKVEDNTLTIAWAPSDGSAPRPVDFSGSVGTVQTWKRVKTLPTFATPQELVDYVSEINGEDSEAPSKTMEQLFEITTDDEIDRFAGLMLRTTSMMQMAAGLGAAFGNAETSEGNDEQQQVAAFLQAVGRMNLIVDKYRHGKPSPEALAAYQEMAGGLNLSMLFQGARPSPTQSVEEYSRKLRLAAGVLSDPKSFATELTMELQNLQTIQTTDETKVTNAEQKSKPSWQVTVNGDTAIATNRSVDRDSSNGVTVTSAPTQMELIKVGDTWKISSLIPDNVIIEMQQGPTVTSSSESSETSSPSMAPAASYSGTNAAVASTNLVPFTQLNSSNTTITPVYTEEQTSVAMGTSATNGKYINRRLKQGEQITADMLIEKPSPEQIREFWLNEAIAGRDVVESMRPLQSSYHPTFLYAMEFPFSASYARRFNAKLPDWIDDYLQAATNWLQQRAPVDWSQEELNILQSMGELIHYQTVNEGHDLSTIKELLTTFVSSDFSAISGDLTNSRENSKAAHSSWLLGELARLDGKLPDKVLASEPLDETAVRKLQLLKTMAENSADDTWISQERRRLFGLAEEAPVQALKLVLTSKPISHQGLLESWIFAISSEETYGAWRSAGDEHFTPPLDPVVAIAVAELLAGKDEVTDNNLALLFQQQHPGYMFARHVDDLLSSELAYRDSVLQLLVGIYTKTKSPLLKTSIGKMAPSVPVRAGEGSATSATSTSAPDADMQAEFLLYFHAAYCAPCQQMTPLIQRLADSKTIAVHMLDVSKNPKPARQLNVDRIPTFVVMRKGQVIGRKSGVMSEDELNTFVKSPAIQSDTEQTNQNTIQIKPVDNETASLNMLGAEQSKNSLETWLKDIRSIGSDTAAKRGAALAEVEAALLADDVAQNITAAQALAQTGDVKFEKAKYRERLLELCQSSNPDLVTLALYALYNTDRRPEDLALAQDVLSKPEAARPGHSISHLLMMFGDGTISGKSEDIVLDLLKSSDRSIRREALRGLWGAKTSDQLMTQVIELVDTPESHHDAIYFALATSPDKNEPVVDKLIEVLSDPDWNNWDRALWGLGYGVREAQQQKVAEAMLQMYENRSDPKTREKCARLIEQYGTEEQKNELQAVTK